jgi:hypothetical protein
METHQEGLRLTPLGNFLVKPNSKNTSPPLWIALRVIDNTHCILWRYKRYWLLAHFIYA